MVRGESQDPLLSHGALNVVILDDDILLQDFDGEDLQKLKDLKSSEARENEKALNKTR